MVPLYVEVGSRGIINDTWGRMCKALCMKKVQNKKLRQHQSDSTEMQLLNLSQTKAKRMGCP
jgi:hypothetical protein